jgi:RNA polymerase sigma-70 factor, ECF subfamily
MFSFPQKKLYKHSSDEELLLFIQKGKEAAFNEIYSRYARKMHFYFYRLLNNDKEKADDFLQDLFLKLIENSTSYNPTLKFSAWLYTVANNMCKNEYRRNSVRGINVELDNNSLFIEESQKSMNHYDKNQLKQRVQSILETMNPDHKITFILRFEEQLSIKEISTILECSEGTVKSRLYYTLKKMGNSLLIFEKIYQYDY